MRLDGFLHRPLEIPHLRIAAAFAFLSCPFNEPQLLRVEQADEAFAPRPFPSTYALPPNHPSILDSTLRLGFPTFQLDQGYLR